MKSESLFLLIFFLFSFIPSRQAFADSGGLKTFVAFDLVGEAFLRSQKSSTREAEIRGVEIFFSTPIDPIFDATVGIDLTSKWREGRTVPFLFQSEIWLRHVRAPGVEREESLGMYLFPQMNIFVGTDFGIRVDQFSTLSVKDALGNASDTAMYRVVPTLTHKPSEFSTFRIAFAWDLEKRNGVHPTEKDSGLMAQLSYVIGAHPSHEF